MDELNELRTRYGMKQMQLEQALEAQAANAEAFVKALDLLRRLKDGEVAIDDVHVTETGFSLKG